MTETQTHKDDNHELWPTVNARNHPREVANRILVHLLLIETIDSINMLSEKHPLPMPPALRKGKSSHPVFNPTTTRHGPVFQNRKPMNTINESRRWKLRHSD